MWSSSASQPRSKENINKLSKIFVVGNTGLDNISKDNCEYTNKVLITLHRRDNHEIMHLWFNELENIKRVLPQALSILSSEGRLVVISFHSLEDRIVKQYFQSIENKTVKLVIKKPISAGEQELINNPRSRSAKLRIIEKTHV